MDRMACVDIVSFGLQILLQKHREWRQHPTALISEDTPFGVILQLNPLAQERGLCTGLKYMSALSLCPTLCAGVVTDNEILSEGRSVLDVLSLFSPQVESFDHEPGVFWLNAHGLGRLYKSTRHYIENIRQALKEKGFAANIALGFSKFGTYGMVRSYNDSVVARHGEHELRLARQVQLNSLGLPQKDLVELDKLGIGTVMDLLQLPGNGVQRRFSEQVFHLYEWAKGALFTPIMPIVPVEPLQQESQLDFPDTDVVRLLFRIKQILGQLLKKAARRQEAVAAVGITLTLDHQPSHEERVCPAQPSLDEGRLIDLVRLRLESLSLPSGVTGVALKLETVSASAEQLMLFALSGKRNLDAADGALARIRAQFGDDSVVRARLCSGHLPEARFKWEPLDKTSFPVTGPSSRRTLVRRIFHRPQPLNTNPVCGPGGIHLKNLSSAPVSDLTGPYSVSGGWWRQFIHRDYYYAKTKSGSILWVYFDVQRRRWFLHGQIS